MKIICEHSISRYIKKIFKTTLTVLNQPKYLSVGLNFVSAAEIKELNRNTRGIDKETDVLSYPNLSLKAGDIATKEKFTAEYDRHGKNLFLGEIVICISIAEKQAREYGHSFERELGFLFVHGLLHLLGYDHIDPQDEKIMRSMQTFILNEVGLKKEQKKEQ